MPKFEFEDESRWSRQRLGSRVRHISGTYDGHRVKTHCRALTETVHEQKRDCITVLTPMLTAT